MVDEAASGCTTGHEYVQMSGPAGGRTSGLVHRSVGQSGRRAAERKDRPTMNRWKDGRTDAGAVDRWADKWQEDAGIDLLKVALSALSGPMT